MQKHAQRVFQHTSTQDYIHIKQTVTSYDQASNLHMSKHTSVLRYVYVNASMIKYSQHLNAHRMHEERVQDARRVVIMHSEMRRLEIRARTHTRTYDQQYLCHNVIK